MWREAKSKVQGQNPVYLYLIFFTVAQSDNCYHFNRYCYAHNLEFILIYIFFLFENASEYVRKYVFMRPRGHQSIVEKNGKIFLCKYYLAR